MPSTYESHFGADTRQASPPGDAMNHLQDDAKALLDSAREQGSEQIEQYRERAADQIKSLADSARAAAEGLEDQNTLGLSHYISDAAQSMTHLADNLRGKSAEELLQQAGQMARDNPALFITGSIALGFALSRFLRASAPDLSSSAASGHSVGTGSNDAGTPYHSEHSEMDSRTASGEGVPVTPAHADDVTHSGQPPRPDPLAAQPTGTTQSANSAQDGIHQSGAEMGTFEPNTTQPGNRHSDPQVTRQPNAGPADDGQTLPKGEL